MKTLKIRNLPYLAALLQAFQFAHAGSVYFGVFGWLLGSLAGTVINLAIAIAGSRISDVAKSRRLLSWVSLAILLLVSPVAIAPATHFALSSVITDGTWRWIVAGLWAAMPDLSILLTGAIAGKALVQGEPPQSGAGATTGFRSSGRRAKTRAKVACKYSEFGCKKTGSINQMNAHAGHCPYRTVQQAEELVSK